MSSKRTFEVITLDDSDDESERKFLPEKPVKSARTAGTGTFAEPINLLDDNVEPASPVPLHSTWKMDDLPRFRPEGGAHPNQHGVLHQNPHRRYRGITHNMDEFGLPDTIPGSYRDDLFDDDFADYGSPVPDLHTEPDLSEQERFNHILEMFPDIAHDHARSLLSDMDGPLAQVIEKLVESPNYPKERDRKASAQREKPVTDEDNDDINVQHLEDHVIGRKRKAILEVLRYEFPKIPICFIRKTQTEKGSLYAAYVALNEAQHTDPPPYNKAPWRPLGILSFDIIGVTNGVGDNVMSDLEKQYKTAKKTCEQINARKRKEAVRKKQEEANIEQAKAMGAVAECAVCFDECPSNRMVQCSQDSPHFTCFECMLNFVKSEVGQSRCRLTCPDSSGCVGTYTESRLRQVPGDEALLEQLFLLQQEQDIRDAGIDDVESCPFCDFKTVCPPMDVDFEFRCQDPDCGMTSCRKCRKERHIPDTCDEAAQKRSEDAALYHRHKIEEAMSEALKRICNKCKKSFVKIDGCNKMTCPGCGNTQSYVCSKNVHGYEHFGRGGCPQMDDVEARHAKEVKEAQEAAQAKIAAENPEVQQEFLEIKVSDAVQQAEAATGLRRPAHTWEHYRAEVMARGAQNLDRIRTARGEQEQRRAEIMRANNLDLLGRLHGFDGNNFGGDHRADYEARLDRMRRNQQEIQDLLARGTARRQDANDRLGIFLPVQPPRPNDFDHMLALRVPNPGNGADAQIPRRIPAGPRPETLPGFVNLDTAPGAGVDRAVPRWREQLLQRRQQRVAPPPQNLGRHGLLGRDRSQPLDLPPPLRPDDWFGP